MIETRIEPRRERLYDMSTLCRVRCCCHGPGVPGRGAGVHVGGPAEKGTTTTLGPYAGHAGSNSSRWSRSIWRAMTSRCCGGMGVFASQPISVAQFEYNHGWVYARCYLRDASSWLSPRLPGR